jgi:hypothetical protein
MERVDRNKLTGRMLLITDQLGAVAREIKHATVRPDGANNIEQAMADLVAQVHQLCSELYSIGLTSKALPDLLAQGVARMDRLELEAQARGWSWIG